MEKFMLVGVVILLAIVLFATGCSQVQKGAAVGGLVGAAVGGVWGAEAGGLNAGEGALAGAAAGGLLGSLIGDVYEQKEIENLKNQIAEKDKEIARLKGENEQLRKEKEDLEKRLADCMKQLEKYKPYTISLGGEVLFNSGKATLKPAGKEMLKRAAQYIKENYPDRNIVIQGHTDNVPIKYSGYKSNWELGAARSLTVLHFLIDQCGIPSERISAQTFGKFKPADDNSTSAGKSHNRRTVIAIMPDVPVEENRIDF